MMKSSRMPVLFNLPESMESAEIFLASDIHNGSAEFDEKRWELFEELLKKDNALLPPLVFLIDTGAKLLLLTLESVTADTAKASKSTMCSGCSIKPKTM